MSIRQGLLTLLDRGPMHGYQLRQDFEAATGSTWPLNVGQVYTTLGRLERDGLVSAEVGARSAQSGAAAAGAHEAQRNYSITPTGRDAVRAWFVTPVTADAPPRNELAIKLALAATTAGVDLSRVIQIQRTATMLSLQNYTRARERAGRDLSWQMVADSLIFTAEAEIRWLDHCEMQLARARRTAEPASDRSADPPATPAMGHTASPTARPGVNQASVPS